VYKCSLFKIYFAFKPVWDVAEPLLTNQ